jgi:hypothetical protein
MQELTLKAPQLPWQPQSKADQQLYQYILSSCVRMPRLAPFIFDNMTLIELAKYLLRYRSGSKATLQLYAYCVMRFCNWLNTSPDQLLHNCKDQDGDPDLKAIAKYNKLLGDYVGELQAEEIVPGAVKSYIKGVKSLCRCNGVRLELPYELPSRTVYKTRAPTPEELQKLLEIADLREKVIILMFATGGFREGTLSKLKYRHVKHDLEAGIVPLHIHVEAEITKGKYHDYDTFLNQEAVDCLKLYLQMRRTGTDKIPPENIHDESPLIRSKTSRKPLAICEPAIYAVVNKLYELAGLISRKTLGRRHDICVHSIRKYFKSVLTSLKVQADYIEYMMGHTISTYQDIQMKGVEFLRGVYVAAGLCIKPKLRVNKIDALKEIIRAWGLNPEEILTRDAQAKSNTTIIEGEQIENNQIRELSTALQQQMLKAIREEQHA